MANAYMKQSKTLPEDNRVDPSALGYLNTKRLPQFLRLLGIEVKPGDKAPETAGVPRLFILDEENPDRPRTLEEEGAEIGSAKFWEYAQQGKLFGYPAGEKDPVQIQLLGGKSGSLSLSDPLSPDKDKLASRNQEISVDKPVYEELPKEVSQPGFFARLLHRINSNWYKAENEAYEANRRERQRISDENRKKKQDYEKRVQEAKAPLDKACQAVSDAAAKAFGAKRTEQSLAGETAQRDARLKEQKVVEAQNKLESNAATAASNEKEYDKAIKQMQSIYQPTPEKNRFLIDKNHFKDASYEKLPKIDLPKGLSIGGKEVDNALFANIALHAQLDFEVCKIHDAHESAGKPLMLDQLKVEGVAEEDIRMLMSHSSAGMLIGDIVKDPPRVQFDQFIDSTIKGRELAKEALTDYQAGRKDKLAQIIVNAAKYTSDCARDEDNLTSSAPMADIRLTGELLDLLDKDDDLMEKAGDLGLTESDYDICRGADYLRELKDANLKAQAEITKAAAGKTELEAKDKQKYVRDIYKFRTAEALIHSQARDDLPQYAQMNKEIADLTKRNALTHALNNGGKMPEGMKPLSDDLRTALTSLVRLKHKKLPEDLKKFAEFREEAAEAKQEKRKPKTNDLDTLAEMTVKSLKLDSMSTAKLAENATLTGGLKAEQLLGLQGKLAADQAKAEQQKKEEAERIKAEYREVDLDTAVLYDKKGRVIGGGGQEAGK